MTEPLEKPSCAGKAEECLLDLYKLFVDTAEKTTDRRMQTNRFYVLLMSGIIAAVAPLSKYISLDNPSHVKGIAMACVLAICICFSWLAHIEYFRKLNKAKFTVILEMEEHLPSRCFKKEWGSFKQERQAWMTSTRIDRMLPIIFMLPFYIGFLSCILSWPRG